MPDDVEVKIAAIVAVTSNGVIGRDNQMPWHLPNDLKYFKETTMGKPVVMGRKTFESIGRPLPGRTNIVVTGNRDYHAKGVEVVYSLGDAIKLARRAAEAEGVKELMIIGGAKLYAEALPLVERLYLTEIKAEIEGDAYFEVLNLDEWLEAGRQDFAAEGANPYNYSFVVYNRVQIGSI